MKLLNAATLAVIMLVEMCADTTQFQSAHPASRIRCCVCQGSAMPDALRLRGGKRGSGRKKQKGKSGWHHFASDDVLFKYEDEDDGEDQAGRSSGRERKSTGSTWQPPTLDHGLGLVSIQHAGKSRFGSQTLHPTGPRARFAGKNTACPVYWQVCEKLNALSVSSVLDLGCGGGALLTWVNILCKNITRYAGTDIHRPALQELVRRFSSDHSPKAVLAPRAKPLHVAVLHGDAAHGDARLGQMEAVVGLNLLEHMRPADLEALPRALFEHARPKFVLLAVQESDAPAMETENPATAHHVEWTEAALERWSAAACQQFPRYTHAALDLHTIPVPGRQAAEDSASGGGKACETEERGKERGGSEGRRRQLAVLFTADKAPMQEEAAVDEEGEESVRREEAWKLLAEAEKAHRLGGPQRLRTEREGAEEEEEMEVVGMLALKEYAVLGKRGLAAMDWFDR